MKNRFLRFLAAAFLLGTPVVASALEGESFVSAPSQTQPMIVDTWGATAEGIGNTADQITTIGQTATGFLQNLLMDWRNGGDLTLKVSQILEDMGLPGGRVLQASIINGVGEAIEKIGTVIDVAVKGTKIAEAIATGDKEAFKKAAADAIIDTVAKLLGQAASKGTFAVLTGATVGWGALPAWGVGELVGWGVESLTKWLLEKYGREALENLLGRLWDFFAGTPFDGQPDDDTTDPNGSNGRYQGLKPIKLL